MPAARRLDVSAATAFSDCKSSLLTCTFSDGSISSAHSRNVSRARAFSHWASSASPKYKSAFARSESVLQRLRARRASSAAEARRPVRVRTNERRDSRRGSEAYLGCAIKAFVYSLSAEPKSCCFCASSPASSSLQWRKREEHSHGMRRSTSDIAHRKRASALPPPRPFASSASKPPEPGRADG